MTTQEMIQKITEKTGCTAEEAARALEMNNYDFLDAIIYAEKTYSTANTGNQSFDASTAQQSYNNPNTGFYQGVNVDESKNNCNTTRGLRGLLGKSMSNGIIIRQKNNELFRTPILLWIVLLFMSVGTVAAVLFFGMFFGAEYSFYGNELGKDKYNRVFARMYEFVQNLKNKLLSN